MKQEYWFTEVRISIHAISIVTWESLSCFSNGNIGVSLFMLSPMDTRILIHNGRHYVRSILFFGFDFSFSPSASASDLITDLNRNVEIDFNFIFWCGSEYSVFSKFNKSTHEKICRIHRSGSAAILLRARVQGLTRWFEVGGRCIKHPNCHVATLHYASVFRSNAAHLVDLTPHLASLRGSPGQLIAGSPRVVTY